MAFAYIQGKQSAPADGINASTVTCTFSAAVGSGHLVAGFVTFDNSGPNTLSSVTDDKGNTYRIQDTATDVPHTQRGQSFYLENITNAPITITANFTTTGGGPNSRQMTVDEFSGTATSASPIDGHTGQFQTNPGAGTDALTSGNATPVTNGCLIYGAAILCSGTASTLASGTGFTTATSGAATVGNLGMASEYLTQSVAAAISATFTYTASTSNTLTFVMAFKPLGAGGPSTVQKSISVSQAATMAPVKKVGKGVIL